MEPKRKGVFCKVAERCGMRCIRAGVISNAPQLKAIPPVVSTIELIVCSLLHVRVLRALLAALPEILPARLKGKL
jgi:hypothetical protein